MLAVVLSALALFPRADITPAPRAPDGRNAQMATLVQNLIAKNTDDAACSALLNEATPMLLAPFRGIPEPGSIYDGLNTVSEKAEAYREVIAQRVTKADPSTAKALTRLADHVLACVEEAEDAEDEVTMTAAEAAEVLARLRGGGGRKLPPKSREWERSIDSALDKAEDVIGELRSTLRAREAFRVTSGDAAVAGFVCGFAFGQIIIGDPMLLGAGLAATAAFANANPEKFSTGRARMVGDAAWRGGSIVRRARARL